MPMNPRLLRPRQSGDRDARRYIAAVEAADQQSLEPAVRMAINAFVVGCKADGIWSPIKASCILAGARTLAGALVPLAGSAITNVNFVTGDWDRKLGLLGGLNKRLTAPFPVDASQQGNRHDACYITQATVATAATQIYFAAGANPTTNAGMDTSANNGRFIFRSWNGANSIINQFSHAGLVAITRTSTTTANVRVNGTTTNVAQGGTPGASAVMNWTNSAGFQHASARFGFFSCGDSLDVSLLDSRVSSLITAIGAAIP